MLDDGSKGWLRLPGRLIRIRYERRFAVIEIGSLINLFGNSERNEDCEILLLVVIFKFFISRTVVLSFERVSGTRFRESFEII